jgi:hypothetical protein
VCSGCGLRGGMIELAAKTWDIDVESTVRKLYALDALKSLKYPLEHHIHSQLSYLAKRERFVHFWESSRKRLLIDNSTTMQALQQKLGVKPNMPSERWLTGPGLFIGGANHDDVERCYAPGLGHLHTRLYAGRLFSGVGWNDVLIFPLVDVPGRVKGFMAYGREGRIPKDLIVKPWCIATTDFNGGLLFYPAVARRPEYQNTLFVLSDPFTALRMHFWHGQDNGDILPLVSFITNGKYRTYTDTWATLPPGPVVFWGPPADLGALVRHARLCDGLISTLPWPVKDAASAFTQKPPAAWLRALRESAVPWEVALEGTLVSAPANYGEELLLSAELTADSLTRFFAGCPAELQDTYRQLAYAQRRVRIANKDVIEVDDTWLLGKTKELISDAVIRIEHAAFNPITSSTQYAGRILFHGHELPFVDASEVMYDSPGAWLRGMVIKSGLGYPQILSSMSHKLIDIATMFHKPETAKPITNIGWDDERCCFVFNSFVVKSGGEVGPVDGVSVMPINNNRPTKSLEKPVGLLGEEVSTLGEDTPNTRLFWACGMGLLAGLLSPLWNSRPRGVAVTGQTVEVALTLWQLMGCVRMSNIWAENSYRWPALYPTPLTTQSVTRILEQQETKDGIIPVKDGTADALCCRTGWHILRVRDCASPAQSLLDVAPKLVPNFIQHIAKRHFQVIPGKGPVSAVAGGLKEWFGGLGGNVAGIDAALAMYAEEYEGCEHVRTQEAFFDLLCSLFEGGELVIAREGFYNVKQLRPGTLVLLKGGKQLFIPMSGLNVVLSKRRAPAVDVDLVTRALITGGLLNGIMIMDGRKGWVVSEDMWERRMAVQRDHNRKSFHPID